MNVSTKKSNGVIVASYSPICMSIESKLEGKEATIGCP